VPVGKILVVDDEKNVLASFEKMLTRRGHEVTTAQRAEHALAIIETETPDVVLMDIRMPGMTGLDAFQRIQALRPRLPVIVMTGYGTTDSAIEATKLGAFEYVLKPFDPAVLLRIIDQALESVRLMKDQIVLAGEPNPPAGDAIIGETLVMQEVYKAIGRVAQTEATVLIRGETGTGKELVARAIYQHSRRSRAPLLLLNCAAIPETLLESELFGHERGAFTGADARRIGKLEQANGGTIFLDEIGDIPPAIQVKILRVLQEMRFERVGGNDTIRTDIRVIAATNRNLEQAIADGRFREDLFHRLHVVTIHVPPLRDRREDIPLLVRHFVGRFSRQMGIEPAIVTEGALQILFSQTWMGNVRELEHCIHRALIYARGYPIKAADVRYALELEAEKESLDSARADRLVTSEEEESLRGIIRRHLGGHAGGTAHRDVSELIDRLLVAEALRLTDGNQTRAARLLGLTRPTLQAKMLRHGIRRKTSILGD
jgi:nitrogen regulation protein NR(I)